MSSLRIASDVSLDYTEVGHRSGVPVLLLHGYTDSRRSYDHVLARMPNSMRAIAISQRGHGDSERPEFGYDATDFASDLAAFMDHLELSQAVVLGHSMGATIAQRFALDYPERTLGLILVGSFFTRRNHPVFVELWNSVVSGLEDPINPETVSIFQRNTVAKPMPPAILDMVVRESLKVPARVWKSTLRALMDSDFLFELSHIKVPTQIVWGDQDRFASRREQIALLAAISHSRLSVYSGVGHAPHWEEPQRFANAVADFVSKLCL